MALELETENSADGFAAYDCSVKHGSGAVAGVFDPICELLRGPTPNRMPSPACIWNFAFNMLSAL